MMNYHLFQMLINVLKDILQYKAVQLNLDDEPCVHISTFST